MKKGEKVLICPKCMKKTGLADKDLDSNDAGYCDNCDLYIPKVGLIKKFARYA